MRSVSEKFNVKAVLPAGSDKKILDYLKQNNVEYDFFEGKMDSGNANTVKRKIERRLNDFSTNLTLAKQLSKYDLKNSFVQIDVAPWAGFLLLFYLCIKTNVFVTFHTALPELSTLRRITWKIKFAILTGFRSFHLAASNLDVRKSLRPFVSESRYRHIEVVYSSLNLVEINKVLEKNNAREDIAGKYHFPSDKKWICNVAQFIERKGSWVFLEAIEILQKNRNDLFFFWLGTTSLGKETVEKIEKFNVGDNFRYLSGDEIGATRDDLLTLWRAADIFVLPSLQEGLPVALIEAMALGKACIASRINAVPEVIEHFETGLLVESGDSRELAQAISELADNPILQKTLGRNGQKLVMKNFEEKIIGQKMCEIYENAA